MGKNLLVRCSLILLSVAAFAGTGFAQMGNGQVASPPAKAECKMPDGKAIHVDYSSPRMRGRAVYGSLVPFGEPWRAGANEANHVRHRCRAGRRRQGRSGGELHAIRGAEQRCVDTGHQQANRRVGHPLSRGIFRPHARAYERYRNFRRRSRISRSLSTSREPHARCIWIGKQRARRFRLQRSSSRVRLAVCARDQVLLRAGAGFVAVLLRLDDCAKHAATPNHMLA